MEITVTVDLTLTEEEKKNKKLVGEGQYSRETRVKAAQDAAVFLVKEGFTKEFERLEKEVNAL